MIDLLCAKSIAMANFALSSALERHRASGEAQRIFAHRSPGCGGAATGRAMARLPISGTSPRAALQPLGLFGDQALEDIGAVCSAVDAVLDPASLVRNAVCIVRRAAASARGTIGRAASIDLCAIADAHARVRWNAHRVAVVDARAAAPGAGYRWAEAGIVWVSVAPGSTAARDTSVHQRTGATVHQQPHQDLHAEEKRVRRRESSLEKKRVAKEHDAAAKAYAAAHAHPRKCDSGSGGGGGLMRDGAKAKLPRTRSTRCGECRNCKRENCGTCK